MEHYVRTLPLFSQGKVRDTFSIPGHDSLLLMVATDRLSTHNIVHRSLIPGKGMILNALSIFWVKEILRYYPTHLMTYGKKIYDYLPVGVSYPEDLHQRAVIVKKLEIIPIEFIWRCRMIGSLYDNFYSKGKENPYGLFLPLNMRKMDCFNVPIFTPTEKSETDDAVLSSEERMNFSRAVHLTRKVYEAGRMYALKKGVDIIDYKGEVGKNGKGKHYIADEILTPDCCRFVLGSDIKIGDDPKWMDKELFRIHARKVWGTGKKEPIDFPSNVIDKGLERYKNLFEVITGGSLEAFQKMALS